MDELSIQNGIQTINSKRFPLCIDPQLQAVEWIKNREKSLIVKSLNEEFMRNMEIAIKTGQSFMFENVGEQLDPMIDPILDQNFIIRAGVKLLTVAGNDLEFNDNFRLYLTTKLGNPF